MPETLHILLDGHACRYKILADGRRQIIAVMLPGDVCDLEAVLLGRAEYGVGLLTHGVVGEIPAERVVDPIELDREMTQALWRQSLRDGSIAREWLVSLGKRTALERLAHLFCELATRVKALGLAHNDEINFPITQDHLAGILGLSKVHVNRTLQELRRMGLIRLLHGLLTIHDGPGLRLLAGFDPAYLEVGAPAAR